MPTDSKVFLYEGPVTLTELLYVWCPIKEQENTQCQPFNLYLRPLNGTKSKRQNSNEEMAGGKKNILICSKKGFLLQVQL